MDRKIVFINSLDENHEKNQLNSAVTTSYVYKRLARLAVNNYVAQLSRNFFERPL